MYWTAVGARDSTTGDCLYGCTWRPTGVYAQRAARYYDAASRLRVADIRVSSSGVTPTPQDYYQSPPSFEEYRYDALGRRVLRRARELVGAATSSYTGQIQRFVWDGDHLIAEIQYPGADGLTATDLERDTESLTTDETAYYGRVIYLTGEVVDRPLSITRMWWPGGTDPFAMSPRWDIQNRGYDHAFYGPGAVCPTCIMFRWPQRQAYGMSISTDPRLAYFEYDKWWGSLTQDQVDATRDLYRRNRYYDPNTGRFTQEDPIGLAGGLNVYGFAGGDPVNFSDPFGLCVGWDITYDKCGNEIRRVKNNLDHDRFYLAANGIVYDFTATLEAMTVTPPDDRDAFQKFGDVVAGFGDWWTFGGTREIREAWVCPGCVNYGSTQYLAGQATALASQVFLAELSVTVRGGELVLNDGTRVAMRINPLGHQGGPWFRRLPHYHRRGPGGIGRHRPWEPGGPFPNRF